MRFITTIAEISPSDHHRLLSFALPCCVLLCSKVTELVLVLRHQLTYRVPTNLRKLSYTRPRGLL